MSKQNDRRLNRRLQCYVARAPAEPRLARLPGILAKRARRAKIKSRLAQYVARE